MWLPPKRPHQAAARLRPRVRLQSRVPEGASERPRRPDRDRHLPTGAGGLAEGCQCARAKPDQAPPPGGLSPHSSPAAAESRPGRGGSPPRTDVARCVCRAPPRCGRAARGPGGTLMRSPAAMFLLAAIRTYQVTLSPILGGHCRFQPTCSRYGAQAIQRFGAIRGSLLAARRLARCHPCGGAGYDPVPEKDACPHDTPPSSASDETTPRTPPR